MVQQSQKTWQDNPTDQPMADHAANPQSVGAWVEDVLGRRPNASPAMSSTTPPPPVEHPASQTVSPAPPSLPVQQELGGQVPASPNPSPDLQSRLAAIARNIETLEAKVTAGPDASTPVHASDPAYSTPDVEPAVALQQTAAAMDPLEALRRRKQELEAGSASSPSRSPHSEAVTPPPQEAPQPTAPAMDHQPSFGATGTVADQGNWGGLSARLDEQFDRLNNALGEVRQLAQSSFDEQAQLRATAQPALDVLPGLQSQVSALEQRMANTTDSNGSLADLSAQIKAVQDTLSAMPAPDAIKSLEDGYHHMLARLDGLKHEGASDEKIDALYAEVTALRESLDGLGRQDTSSVLDEMRAMVARLENEPNPDNERIAAALESVGAMAKSGDPAIIHDAIGAVVERLVALEARIEALAAGNGEDPLAARLDTIQAEMQRLATFQDEARGLSQALDAIRTEVRASTPSIDMSLFDDRFQALGRIEEMTGEYAEQINALSERLSVLDNALSGQTDMARQVSALSRQMDSFTNTIPVREIEQALLDLTGRVTALQEDTGTERLAVAVKELGQRVESCMKSIPNSDAIIDAVEAKLEQRFAGFDQRLDGMHQAITSADSPLIDHVTKQYEALVAAMPTSNADTALGTLEQRLAELSERYDQAGMVTREEVANLNNELARARASVELGSNRDLQRAIVDQVRHLADRFETVRTSNDATLLPELEEQIDALSNRVQAIGLFDANQPVLSDHALPDTWMERIEASIDQAQAKAHAQVQSHLIPGVDHLQDELSLLRQSAQDQDQRMHATLETVQSALETVVRRLNDLERDDQAARNLVAQDTSQPKTSSQVDETENKTAPAAQMPHPGAQSDDGEPGIFDLPAPQPLPADTAAAPLEPFDLSAVSASNPPAPGDAKDLLRQLSGAMDDTESRRDPTASPSRATRPARAPRQRTPKQPVDPTSDVASQRANFIAAARRAAQSAALQAGSGGRPAPAAAFGAAMAAQTEPSLASPAAEETPPNSAQPHQASPVTDPRIEPGLDADDTSANQPTNPLAASAKPDTPIGQLGMAAKTARVEQEKKKEEEQKRQKVISRAMVVALVLFTVGLGLFVVSLIWPTDRAANTVIAPITAPSEPAQNGEPADIIGDTAPLDESGLAPDDRAADDPAEASVTDGPVRVVGEERIPTTDLQAAVAQSNLDVSAAIVLDDAINGEVSAADGTATQVENTLGAGFSRDRGPVMTQTPDIASDISEGVEGQVTTPVSQTALLDTAVPADTLGPLSGLTVPSLPPATASALPEAIGSPRLRVAAAGGDASAQFEVATRFMEGRFVSQDFPAAAHWYGLAADQGLAPAAYRLGTFYEQGRGIDRDSNTAIAWYERAASIGNPRAMHNLAVMAAEGRDSAPDFERAAAWFQAAASRGLADSQFNLAVLYARGMGVERDLMESYKWFALSANAGDTEAVARRDEVAGVLGEEALTLARARVDNWTPLAIEPSAVAVVQPEGGWDDTPVRADSSSQTLTASSSLIAEAQSLLAQRGYDPGPADGLIGPRTTQAVRAFRQSMGLSDSGAIDAALVQALRESDSL